MHFHPHLMRHVFLSGGNLWKNKNSGNGTKEKKTSRESKTKDLTFSKVLWLKGKRKPKKSMRKERRRFDLRRLKTRKELWLRFKENVLRC